MRTTRLALFLVALTSAALLWPGCARRQLTTGSVKDIQKLAIVVRATGGPNVNVAQSDANEGRIYPTMSPADADKQLKKLLAKSVNQFEIEERVRTSVVGKLPAVPPWSDAMPSVEVATALDTLLVKEPTAPDYSVLARKGADAVLELTVTDWGMKNAKGKTGFFMKGTGQMFKIDGGKIWVSSLDFDDTRDEHAENVDVMEVKKGNFKDALQVSIDRLGDRLAKQLAPERDLSPAAAPAEPPAGEQPLATPEGEGEGQPEGEGQQP